MTGRLWDQRFQGNRFVILDQELIHDSQDKPIDLNQGKKEFTTERSEYKMSLNTWSEEYKERIEILNFSRALLRHCKRLHGDFDYNDDSSGILSKYFDFIY